MADSPCCQLWMICDGVHGLSERSGRGGVAGGWSSWTVIRPDCYSRLQCNSSWPSSTHSGWWGELTQLSGRGERRSINGQDDCSGSFVTSSTLCWSSKSGRLRGKDKARPIKSIIRDVSVATAAPLLAPSAAVQVGRDSALINTSLIASEARQGVISSIFPSAVVCNVIINDQFPVASIVLQLSYYRGGGGGLFSMTVQYFWRVDSLRFLGSIGTS